MRDKSQVVIPLNIGIKLPENDPVFKLIEICEELDYTKLFETYLKVWRKVNPITMFEIIVYAYMNGIYSSRKIVAACMTDIRFMWILGDEPVPSVATVKRFQNERLGEVIEDLFFQLLGKLYEMGELKFRNIFVDGTKIEANANKYTFVWKKAVEKNSARLEAKIESKLSIICERYGMQLGSLEDTYENLVHHAELIRLEFVSGKGIRKTQLQRDIEELYGYIAKRAEYLRHLGHMKGRNSYSKTDVDATFMHMKEDHMINGQLKPGYNVQIGVEGEYIVGLGIFSNRTDVQTLIPFLERIKKYSGRVYERVIADAGYESRENYMYLEENGQESYVKPANYEISKTRAYKANKFSIENMHYDKEADTYTCANGDVLYFSHEKIEKSANGYEISVRYYRNRSCEGCPYAGKCHRSTRGFREIKVSPEFMRQRKRSLENITTDEGVLLRRNRSIQVEGVFGVLKQDFGFKRFLVRGKRNVETQFFLLSFAFNVKKLCNKIESGRLGQDLFQMKVA